MSFSVGSCNWVEYDREVAISSEQGTEKNISMDCIFQGTFLTDTT